MAPTYGLAEQAAMIIKSQYDGTPSPAALQATGSATETAANPTGTSSSNKQSGSASRFSTLHSSISTMGVVVLAFILPAMLF